MLSAIAAWLGTEGLKILLGAAASAFMQWWASVQAEQAQREAGRAAANADTLRQNGERVTAARQVENEASAAHAAKPDSDDAFDRSFERKG